MLSGADEETYFIVNSFDKNMIVGGTGNVSLNGTANDDAIAGGAGDR